MNSREDTETWFSRTILEAMEFAVETKAPVIGYAFINEHTRGRGYFRTDRLKAPAAKLRRMVAQMQKRGVRAEIYEIGGQTT